MKINSELIDKPDDHKQISYEMKYVPDCDLHLFESSSDVVNIYKNISRNDFFEYAVRHVLYDHPCEDLYAQYINLMTSDLS
jgi:hypothetical protein